MSDFFWAYGFGPALALISDFWAYGFGPVLAVILFVVLPALALYHARDYVKRF